MGGREVCQKSRETRLEFAAPLSVGIITAFVLSLCVSSRNGAASAADAAGVDLRVIQQEINKIKKNESAERRRVDQDEQTIQTLEQQLQRLESGDAVLAHQAEAVEATS